MRAHVRAITCVCVCVYARTDERTPLYFGSFWPFHSDSQLNYMEKGPFERNSTKAKLLRETVEIS